MKKNNLKKSYNDITYYVMSCIAMPSEIVSKRRAHFLHEAKSRSKRDCAAPPNCCKTKRQQPLCQNHRFWRWCYIFIHFNA